MSSKKTSYLLKGALVVGLKVFQVLATIAGLSLLARWTSVETVGAFSYALSIFAVAILPSTAGMPILVVRETSKMFAIQNQDAIKVFWKWANGKILVASCISMLCAIAYVYLSAPSRALYSSIVMLVGIPLNALVVLNQSKLRGLESIGLSLTPVSAIFPTLILVFWFFTLGRGVVEENADMRVSLSYLSAWAFTCIICIFSLNRVARGKLTSVCHSEGVEVEKIGSKLKYWKFSKSARVIAVQTGVLVINSNLGILILAKLFDLSVVAIFKVALQIAMAGTIVLVSINHIIAPKLVKIDGVRLNAKMIGVVRASSFLSAASFLIYWLVLFLISKPLIEAVFGPIYLAAIPVMHILMLGQFINSLFGPVLLALNMMGHEDESIKAAVLSLIVNAALSTSLVGWYGEIGIAIAFSASILTLNLYAWWSLKAKEAINTLPSISGLVSTIKMRA